MFRKSHSFLTLSLLLFAGCSNAAPEVNGGNDEIFSFHGTIVEINEDGSNMIVKPDDEEEIRKSGSLVTIPISESDDHEYTVGDEIDVEYGGDVMEIDPLQVHVIDIKPDQED